jgi:hypothetical protein
VSDKYAFTDAEYAQPPMRPALRPVGSAPSSPVSRPGPPGGLRLDTLSGRHPIWQLSGTRLQDQNPTK